MSRDFKGIWIPKEVWENKGLTPTDRCLLAEISSLCSLGKCFATNKYFADFFGVSVATVSRSISKLESMSLIQCVLEPIATGSRRVIQIDEGSNQNDKGVLSNCVGGSYQNDIHNNTIDNNTNNNTLKEYTEDFDDWWEKYHSTGKSKSGKAATYKHWERLRKSDKELCASSVSAYVNSREVQFLKAPYNYLRDRRFEDEIDTSQQTGTKFNPNDYI